MLIALHKNARTTPAVRSSETASVLSQRFGITEQTVYKCKKREVFGDCSHTAHRLHRKHQTHPHLFHKRPYNRPGCDN